MAAPGASLSFTAKFYRDIEDDVVGIFEDVKNETIILYNSLQPSKENIHYIKQTIWSVVHIPYFPAFHSPGWLLRYLVGPFDRSWLTDFLSDVGAGLTVGLVLIPQVRLNLTA